MKIIIITLSPALDVEYHTLAVNNGINRTYSHTLRAGGKGINVARAIIKQAKLNGTYDELDLQNIFPAGGDTGDLLIKILDREGIPRDTINIDLPTRVNVSLIPELGDTVEINAPGTAIGEKIYDVTEKTATYTREKDAVFAICGSSPLGVEKTYISTLCEIIKKSGHDCIVDCDGEALRHAVLDKKDPIKYPTLIKPNLKELSELTGKTLKTALDVENASRELVKNTGNTTSVIATMGKDGAVVSYPDGGEIKCKHITSEQRKVCRKKGAGDTFLGTYIYERYIGGKSPEYAASSASSAAADYVEGL